MSDIIGTTVLEAKKPKTNGTSNGKASPKLVDLLARSHPIPGKPAGRATQREVDSALEVCREIGSAAIEAMHYLLKAHNFALQLDVGTWDFAVELDFLRRLKIDSSELRWLVGAGLLQQAEEITAPGDSRRVFDHVGFLSFDSNTCFVLTELGVAVAAMIRDHRSEYGRPQMLQSLARQGEDSLTVLGEKPEWHSDRQQLYFAGKLVKEFRLPSPNQTAILAAFEEEAWPPHIDDPLPQCPVVGPKERLRYTIKSLNKHQKHRLLRFRGDGRGEGICWEARK